MAGWRDHLAIARGRLLGHAVVFVIGVDLFVAAFVIGVQKCLWFVRQCWRIQRELSLLPFLFKGSISGYFFQLFILQICRTEYLLRNWQLIKKFQPVCEIQIFITVYRRSHLLPYHELHESSLHLHTVWFILILSPCLVHDLTPGPLCSDFPLLKFCVYFSSSPICCIPAHLILLDFFSLLAFNGEKELSSFPLCKSVLGNGKLESGNSILRRVTRIFS